MSETIWKPLIVAVQVSQSPAVVGVPFRLTVTAYDIFGGEQEDSRLCGEWYCGEV